MTKQQFWTKYVQSQLILKKSATKDTIDSIDIIDDINDIHSLASDQGTHITRR